MAKAVDCDTGETKMHTALWFGRAALRLALIYSETSQYSPDTHRFALVSSCNA